ncbi:ATP-grasp fold amidoligase family protein, partial [Halomonas sp. AOP22-C1-8]|uniref:ATP-grasp fold amidoligase family protein n=1 Tax=Halomonas sp. AOP22-C1-8 TaxID=3457717 RepID=UPI004034D7B1
LDGRINKLKQLTLPDIKELKDRPTQPPLPKSRPPFYDSLRMFTYIVDRDFDIEQKKWFIEKQCMRGLKYFPNIDNPKSFNEKTQWYKLYYQDPLITKCIDKYEFKDHVAGLVGERYVTPLLGVWDNAREIDFEKLPNKFVLKSNWGSGSRHVLLVRDKKKLNLDEVRFKLNTWIQPWENVYYHTFDWGYKNIKPKIIAEVFIENKTREYKFFCFNGEPVYFYVATDSSPGVANSHNYYDMDWNLLPFTRHARNSKDPIEKPSNFDEMVELCRTLSKPFPHVRVDLCQTESNLLIEELTFYTGSGTGRFNPTEWDYKFGEAFVLPEKRFI